MLDMISRGIDLSRVTHLHLSFSSFSIFFWDGGISEKADVTVAVLAAVPGVLKKGVGWLPVDD